MTKGGHVTTSAVRHNWGAHLVVAGAVVLSGLVLTSPAGATSRHRPIAPTCRASQMRTSLVFSRTPYAPSRGLRATLWYTNSGATCSLSVDNVPLEAVSGPQRTPVGSSLSGAVAYPLMTLTHAQRAFAPVSISSITSRAFRKAVREHGGPCGPRYADAIELVSPPHSWWPARYFVLSEKVPVCTKGYDNVAAGVITKSSRLAR